MVAPSALLGQVWVWQLLGRRVAAFGNAKAPQNHAVRAAGTTRKQGQLSGRTPHSGPRYGVFLGVRKWMCNGMRAHEAIVKGPESVGVETAELPGSPARGVPPRPDPRTPAEERFRSR